MPPPDDQRGGARVAAICALLVIASFVASKAARDAILLANFSIKSLPIFIAISAAGSLPIILVAGGLMTRHGPTRLTPALNLVSAAIAVAEWWLLPHFPRPVSAIVYFHLATSGAVLVSGFWSIVNERFDVQSAKRHIGRIGIGATFGGILGGVIAERTAVHLPPGAILLVLAGLQVACAATLRLVGRKSERPAVAPQAAAPAGPAAERDTWRALREVTRSPLLRNLGGVVVLGAIAGGIMDYVFKADIVHASSRDGLLRSLAIFYTVTSVLTAVLQIALCAPVIARLGVPRSVATLPATVTVFGAIALIVPVPLSAAVARGAELVTRNSIYRAGYELLYAPLAEDHKRSTKVVLDVGADRVGDMLGAQLVGVIVYLMAEPRAGLLIATAAMGALGLALAMRLPRNYTAALEESLLARAPASEASEPHASPEPEPWITLSGVPTLGVAGDLAPLNLRVRDRSRRRRHLRTVGPATSPTALAAAATGETASVVQQAPDVTPGSYAAEAHHPLGSHEAHASHHDADPVVHAIADLRSHDPDRIARVLAAGLTPPLAAQAIELVGDDGVALAVLAALRAVAPQCTGLIVDALVNPERDVAIRRRLPAVLLAGEPALAAWGLWRALGDASFDVRYRAGAVLARFAEAGHLKHISTDDVFEAVRRELIADRSLLARPRVVDDLVGQDQPAGEHPTGELPTERMGAGLEHVFTVLGLALPAEPLRIALHAVQHDDPELRGTALEYLESILPTDVRAQLWPVLEGEGQPPPLEVADAASAPPAPRPARSQDEILAALRQSYDSLRRAPKSA